MTRLVPVVAVATLLLAGCSGSRPFAVARTPNGSIEVLSACDDAGVGTITVIDDTTGEVLVQLRTTVPPQDLPDSVVVSDPPPSHQAEGAPPRSLSGVVQVSASYPLAGTFTDPVVVDLDELAIDQVATGTVSRAGEPRTQIESRAEFEGSLRSCRGWSIPPAAPIVALVALGAGAIVAGAAIWRFVRKPSSASTRRSRLAHPPPPPEG